ncbi:hypothetical protein [Rossellomorea arthrocnemi]|uniref:hypothetical protein n=1 Tax=Rossellomorea arthrocnemi TaxID=2769542 RepID=UPI00191B1E9C|nr:hypothetical protein [Rossellomorea arthrocnemi]
MACKFVHKTFYFHNRIYGDGCLSFTYRDVLSHYCLGIKLFASGEIMSTIDMGKGNKTGSAFLILVTSAVIYVVGN